MAQYNEKDIPNLTKNTIGKLNMIMRVAALNLFKQVILKTPVDTGRARGNWQTTVGGYAQGTTGAKSESEVLNEMVQTLQGERIKKGFFLTNNLPYIQKLEYGGYPNPAKDGTYVGEGKTKGPFTGPGFYKFSENGFSKQAPQGMVRISIQQIKEDLSEIIEDVVSKQQVGNIKDYE